MAVIKHTVGLIYKTDVGTITSTTDEYTGDEEVNIRAVVPGSTSNMPFIESVTRLRVQSLVFFSTQDLIVKINSTADTNPIALKANKQLVWTKDHLEDIPLLDDVTEFYFSNTGGTAANVEIRVLSRSASFV